MEVVEDEEILRLFYLRSESAIEAVADKYGGACRRIAYNILNNSMDVEECVNDTYLGLWNSIPPERPNPLFPYIYRVARNLSVKRYDYNMAMKRNSSYDVALEELEDCIPSGSSVEDILDTEQLTRMIEAFLDSLDKKSRVMFVRRYWFSDSISEIAATMNISSHNVTVKLSRIRKKLEKYLRKEGIWI